eukprot:g25189.t1
MTSLEACKTLCLSLGASCKGVEFNNLLHTCVIWKQEIDSVHTTSMNDHECWIRDKDVLINGKVASERHQSLTPYAGTVYTDADSLGEWRSLFTQQQNLNQASFQLLQTSLLAKAEQDL